MTNEEMLRKLANGELPCTRLASGQLCVVPQETLRMNADEPGFLEIVGGEVVALLKENEVVWVLPRRPA